MHVFAVSYLWMEKLLDRIKIPHRRWNHNLPVDYLDDECQVLLCLLLCLTIVIDFLLHFLCPNAALYKLFTNWGSFSDFRFLTGPEHQVKKMFRSCQKDVQISTLDRKCGLNMKVMQSFHAGCNGLQFPWHYIIMLWAPHVSICRARREDSDGGLGQAYFGMILSSS